MYLLPGADCDEWDDEWDDSTGGYPESESGEGGAMQRGGAHAPSMKISLNKYDLIEQEVWVQRNSVAGSNI